MTQGDPHPPLRASPEGRPAYAPLTMVKIIILQQRVTPPTPR